MLLLNILSILSIPTSILGLVTFSSNPSITIICALIALFDCLANVFCKSQDNVSKEVIAIIVGIIVAVINDFPWYLGAAAGLCLATAIMNTLGFIFILFTSRRK